MSPQLPLGFSFADEDNAPSLPPGFQFADEPLFPESTDPASMGALTGPPEPFELRRSVLGNYLSKLPVAGMSLLKAPIEGTLIAGNALGGLPDAYNELRAGSKTAPEIKDGFLGNIQSLGKTKLGAALGAPTLSLLQAATRNVPKKDQLQQQGRIVASTYGGAAGTGIGMLAGNPLTAMLSGAAGSVAADRYAREKYQEKGMMPQGDQWEEDKEDASNLLVGETMGPAVKLAKDYSAYSSGKAAHSQRADVFNIYERSNPGALQARGLTASSKDVLIRRPRTGNPDPLSPDLYEVPDSVSLDNVKGQTIDVVGLKTSQNKIKSTKEYSDELSFDENPDNLPAIRDDTNPSILKADAPAIIKEKGDIHTSSDLMEIPEEQWDSYEYQPEVAKEVAEQTAKETFNNPAKPLTAEQQAQRKSSGQYYLDQGLNEPGMDMLYKRNGVDGEFDLTAQHARERTTDAKNRQIKILRDIPPEKAPTVKAGLFTDLDSFLAQKNTINVERKVLYDVWHDEMDGLGPRLMGWTDKSPETQEFRHLLRKQKLGEKGGGRQLGENGEFPSKLTPEQQVKLNGWLKEISNKKLSLEELDNLKTQFAGVANYNKSRAFGVDERSNRATVYELMADNARNTLESAVHQFAPDQFPNYRNANREMYLYQKILNLAEKRAAEERLNGRNTDLDQRTTSGDPTTLGILGRGIDSIKETFLANPKSREGMMRQADKTPHNMGTGMGMFQIPKYLSGIQNIRAFLNEAVTDYQKATTSRFGGTRLDPGTQVGLEGVLAGRLATKDNHTGFDVIDNTIAPYLGDMMQNQAQPYGREQVPPTPTPTPAPAVQPGVMDKLSSVLGAVNPFQANTAMAEEMPEKLPRNTQDFKQDQVANFLMQTINTPQAPIAQALVQKLQQAVQAQDMDKVERLHADMARVFPDLFEQGTGVNGKVFYPDEQTKIMENLRQLHRQGQVDSIQLAKQRNAFMNPMDSRILPVERKKQAQSSGPNQMVNGTRTYAY